MTENEPGRNYGASVLGSLQGSWSNLEDDTLFRLSPSTEESVYVMLTHKPVVTTKKGRDHVLYGGFVLSKAGNNVFRRIRILITCFSQTEEQGDQGLQLQLLS